MPYYCAIHTDQVVDNGAIPCPKCVQWRARFDAYHAEGVQACKSGLLYSANPYTHVGDGTGEVGWRAGWCAEHYASNPRPPALFYKQYREARK